MVGRAERGPFCGQAALRRHKLHNWKVSAGPAPSHAPGKGPSWPLPAPGGSGSSLAHSHITPAPALFITGFSCVSLGLLTLSSLLRTLLIEFRAHPNPGWAHLQNLNLITLAKAFFPQIGCICQLQGDISLGWEVEHHSTTTWGEEEGTQEL